MYRKNLNFKVRRVFFFILMIMVITLPMACQRHLTAQEATNSTQIKVKPPRQDSILSFDSMITDIMEDSKGNLWFGSYGNGICVYDGKTYSYYTAQHGLPSERFHEEVSRRVPMGDLIRSIQEDANGDIIIHSAEEIFKFNRNTITVLDRPAEHTSIATIKNPRRWKVELNKLWFQAENNNGAYTYANGRLQHRTLPPEYLSGGGSAFQYATYALLKDRKNNIWLGTAEAGIMKFDGQTFTCINANKTKGTVRSIFEDNNGRIWISNVLQGLNYYEKGQLVNFTKEIGYYTLSEVRNNGTLDGDKYLDGIQTIEQDEKGNMWFGSYSEGLWRYDGKNLTHFTTANGLPSNTVKTIYKINTGELIFGIGLESSGIYRFDGEGFVRM